MCVVCDITCIQISLAKDNKAKPIADAFVGTVVDEITAIQPPTHTIELGSPPIKLEIETPEVPQIGSDGFPPFQNYGGKHTTLGPNTWGYSEFCAIRPPPVLDQAVLDKTVPDRKPPGDDQPVKAVTWDQALGDQDRHTCRQKSFS